VNFSPPSIQTNSRFRDRVLLGLRVAFCLMIGCLLLFLGSVRPFPLHSISFGLLAISLVATLLFPLPKSSRLTYHLILGAAVLLTLWVLAQTLDLHGLLPSSPAWDDVERLLGHAPHTISIAPGDTLEALVPTVMPFIIFLTGLQLFQSDEPAWRMLRLLTLFGIAAATFGLLQFLLFPKMLLVDTKVAYLDSLTAIFVNRNTAATFLGMMLILSVGFMFGLVQKVGIKQYIALVFGMPSRAEKRDRRWVAVFAIGSAILFMALILTKSRAGVASSLGALAVVLLLLAFFGGQRSSATGRNRFLTKQEFNRRRNTRIITIIALMALAGGLYTGRVMLRASARGLEDQRFCIMPGLTRMMRDNWMTGTGLGTFQDAFPAYRDPACSIRGVFEKAHNVYIEGVITLGVPFVAIAAAVLVTLAVIMINGMRHRRQYRWVPISGFGILLLLAAHSAVDFSIQIPGLAAATAAIMAAICTIALKKPEKRSKPAFSNSTPAPDDMGAANRSQYPGMQHYPTIES
jgi:hypothetical protein